MDSAALVEALDRAGIPRVMYEVEGVREFGDVPPTDFYFLRRRGDRWQVGVYERGEYDPFEEHDTEDAATAALYRRVTGSPAR
ncbi:MULTISPECIES: hypothetical protein [Saccharothrix]|uniref:hypothetical protein n=1 Tax=Saccharothrix TaxID=2071 RepID=UPI00095E6B89|nr:hypothetical protein [Saccharothrix sp. CB00851]OKI15375.1 hypothetical protein A6A25_13715 [Saccharothrix sp. CB00851]